MKLFLFTAVMLAFASTNVLAFDHSHSKWDKVLKDYQNENGLVNYKKLKADANNKEHSFNSYLSEVSGVSESEYNKFKSEEKMAFLINAYNAFTFKLIVDNYPVKSIKDIGSLFTSSWKKEFFSMLGGKVKSLDPIEHEWLRPKFKDYRIHAAVNCASISCPPLRHEAFLGSNLDKQLDEQMSFWLKDESRNRFDEKFGKLYLSKIFDWYGDDFEKWGDGIKAVVKKFGPKAAVEAIKKGGDIDYLDYDWGLNEAK